MKESPSHCDGIYCHELGSMFVNDGRTLCGECYSAFAADRSGARWQPASGASLVAKTARCEAYVYPNGQWDVWANGVIHDSGTCNSVEAAKIQAWLHRYEPDSIEDRAEAVKRAIHRGEALPNFEPMTMAGDVCGPTQYGIDISGGPGCMCGQAKCATCDTRIRASIAKHTAQIQAAARAFVEVTPPLTPWNGETYGHGDGQRHRHVADNAYAALERRANDLADECGMKLTENRGLVKTIISLEAENSRLRRAVEKLTSPRKRKP